MDIDSPIQEFHHEKWWRESWEMKYKEGANEVYIPLIFYMDGISVDQNSCLTLTPFNMTLGIFNTETCQKQKHGKLYISILIPLMRIYFN